MSDPIKVLVLGASGMLGSAMMRVFARSPEHTVIGTVRAMNLKLQALAPKADYIVGVNALQNEDLVRLFQKTRPDVVINAVGLIKQHSECNDVSLALPINALLPHRLLDLSSLCGARLIQISTDCVFTGAKGNYTESDRPDAYDTYGISKYLGEISGSNAITLRTSIIGHELGRSNGLIEWFLSQRSRVRGFRNAFFSGLPTIELARIVKDYVLPNGELKGLYHVSAERISKYELLKLVAKVYDRKITIDPDDSVVIDRSLCSKRFHEHSSYTAPKWLDLIQSMKDDWAAEK